MSGSAWMKRAAHAAAAGAAALLAACGGGGGGGSTPVDPPPAAAPEALSTAQPGEVLAYVKQRLASRGPQGGGDTYTIDTPPWLDVVTTFTGVATRSGTVVQEAGVDEEDLIKTDGQRIYTLQPVRRERVEDTRFAQLDVHVLDATGKPQRAGSIELSTTTALWNLTRGMVLADGQPRLAVISDSDGGPIDLPICPEVCTTALLPFRPSDPKVHLHFVDASQPAAMPAPRHWQIDGRLVGTRQVGNTLYLVATHAPRLAYDRLPVTSSAAERQAALDRMTVAELLPRIRIDGGEPQPLVSETDCWLQGANASAQIALTTITAIDLASTSGARSSRCFVGGTEALYMAPANLYLATTRYEVEVQRDGLLRFPAETNTDIHKFAVDGRTIGYRGSGRVAGHLGWDRERTPYRMSEHQGHLRVLSFTGTLGWATAADATRVAASPATLTVLREAASGGALERVSTLPNAQRPAAIGKPGEQVYGVRFAGDRAYVVTFRRTDPLYVLDLANPADPRTAGELEMPGFSDWLYPVDGGLLFGVGKDADTQGRVQGVKVALFDVANPAQPRQIDSRSFGGPGSATALDYSAHGIGWLQLGDVARVALPMQLMPLDGSRPQKHLQRFEIDARRRTLLVKPTMPLGEGWFDLGSTRTLLLGEQLYHLSEGTLAHWAW